MSLVLFLSINLYFIMSIVCSQGKRKYRPTQYDINQSINQSMMKCFFSIQNDLNLGVKQG